MNTLSIVRKASWSAAFLLAATGAYTVSGHAETSATAATPNTEVTDARLEAWNRLQARVGSLPAGPSVPYVTNGECG